MTNQTLISVDKRRVGTAPGAAVDLAVTAENLTSLVDQVALRAEGVDSSWYQVIPAYLPVFAQGQATARIVFLPPRDPAVSVAGRYPLRICAASQEYPGQEGEDTSELEIQLVGDYRIWLERGETVDRLESAFTVKVENSANAPLRVQFKGDDQGDALWFKFDPFQLTIPAGGKASTALTLRSKNTAGGELAIPFTLTAEGEFMPLGSAAVTAPVHQVAGQFVQGAPARLAITVEPPEVESADRGWYRVRVANPGAAPTTVQLTAESESNHLRFIFEHVQLTLRAQSETSVSLVVRAQNLMSGGTRERYEFRVAAQPIDSEIPGASAQAALVQVSMAKVLGSTAWVWVVVAIAILCVFLTVFALFAGVALRILR